MIIIILKEVQQKSLNLYMIISMKIKKKSLISNVFVSVWMIFYLF